MNFHLNLSTVLLMCCRPTGVHHFPIFAANWCQRENERHRDKRVSPFRIYAYTREILARERAAGKFDPPNANPYAPRENRLCAILFLGCFWWLIINWEIAKPQHCSKKLCWIKLVVKSFTFIHISCGNSIRFLYLHLNCLLMSWRHVNDNNLLCQWID